MMEKIFWVASKNNFIFLNIFQENLFQIFFLSHAGTLSRGGDDHNSSLGKFFITTEATCKFDLNYSMRQWISLDKIEIKAPEHAVMNHLRHINLTCDEITDLWKKWHFDYIDSKKRWTCNKQLDLNKSFSIFASMTDLLIKFPIVYTTYVTK